MICILLLSVMFIMHFNGQNKDIYMFIYLFIYCFRDWEGKIDKWAYQAPDFEKLWAISLKYRLLKSWVGRMKRKRK